MRGLGFKGLGFKVKTSKLTRLGFKKKGVGYTGSQK